MLCEFVKTTLSTLLSSNLITIETLQCIMPKYASNTLFGEVQDMRALDAMHDM